MSKGKWLKTRVKLIEFIKSQPNNFWWSKTYIRKKTGTFWNTAKSLIDELHKNGTLEKINTSSGEMYIYKPKNTKKI